jgi:hypothetical protein
MREVPAMTVMDVERHCEALFETDATVFVETCAVDGGGLVSLTVESASMPVTVDGWTTFQARLVGSAESAIKTPGRHRAYHAGRAFWVNITPQSRRGSLVAYGAFVLEPRREFV